MALAVVPLCVTVLVGLFLVQRKGTAFIGTIFGPLMLLWFLATGLLGGLSGSLKFSEHAGRTTR